MALVNFTNFYISSSTNKIWKYPKRILCTYVRLTSFLKDWFVEVDMFWVAFAVVISRGVALCISGRTGIKTMLLIIRMIPRSVIMLFTNIVISIMIIPTLLSTFKVLTQAFFGPFKTGLSRIFRYLRELFR